MDSHAQTGVMFPFGICFGLLAFVVGLVVFVSGMLVGGLSTVTYIVRFKPSFATDRSSKDEKKKSKGKTEEVKDNSPAVPPITGAFEPALDPFGYLGLGGLPPLGPVGKRAVSEDSRISSPPPPPPPAGFVDPFAGIVFPKTPKKSSKYPSYGNRYPNIPLSPPTRALKTPEKQYEDPFSHLGRPDYMAPAPPRAPAAGTASSFSYDPFASGKLPPDPEPAYGDPFAGMKFSNLGQGDRLKFDDKSEANLQSCICCERGVRPDKTEYVDNSTTLSKSSIDEEDEKLGFVDVLSKVKVMPQLGNLAVQSRPGKDILTPPSSVDAAEVVPLSDQEAAEKKAAEKKKRIDDIVQSLQMLLQEV